MKNKSKFNKLMSRVFKPKANKTSAFVDTSLTTNSPVLSNYSTSGNMPLTGIDTFTYNSSNSSGSFKASDPRTSYVEYLLACVDHQWDPFTTPYKDILTALQNEPELIARATEVLSEIPTYLLEIIRKEKDKEFVGTTFTSNLTREKHGEMQQVMHDIVCRFKHGPETTGAWLKEKQLIFNLDEIDYVQKKLAPIEKIFTYLHKESEGDKNIASALFIQLLRDHGKE